MRGPFPPLRTSCLSELLLPEFRLVQEQCLEDVVVALLRRVDQGRLDE